MSGNVIDFSTVATSVKTPDLQTQLTLANASASVIVAAVGMQGVPGSARNVTQEFTAGAGGYTVTMAAAIGTWHALFVSGIRQQPSSYSVSGTSLIIPVGLTYAGAVCCFDYLPA